MEGNPRWNKNCFGGSLPVKIDVATARKRAQHFEKERSNWRTLNMGGGGEGGSSVRGNLTVKRSLELESGGFVEFIVRRLLNSGVREGKAGCSV